eukprot:6223952-Amphidinium_carterae.1
MAPRCPAEPLGGGTTHKVEVQWGETENKPKDEFVPCSTSCPVEVKFELVPNSIKLLSYWAKSFWGL